VVDPLDILASQMAQALRAETATDKFGRTYRVNHSVRIGMNGVQATLWSEMEFAGRDHMERSFGQRREQIVGDCYQLRIDVDAYNEKNREDGPIQLVLNFTEDVAEKMIVEKSSGRRDHDESEEEVPA